MSVDDVAAQLWGHVQQAYNPTPQDIAQVGPAPRSIDQRMEGYTKRAVTSLAPMWLVFAIIFCSGDALMMARGAFHLPVLSLVFLGLTIWSFRWRSRERDRVLEAMQTGELLRAQVVAMRAVERRGRYGQVQYVTYYVTFALPHGKVELVTKDPGISLLQVGVTEEILWTQAQPNVVVPTFMLM